MRSNSADNVRRDVGTDATPREVTRLVETRGVGFVTENRRILHEIDFHVDEGEIVTIVGANGSGKTTLLKILIGACKPTSGTVIRDATAAMGYVPQHLNQESALPLTVRRFLNLPAARSKSQLDDALEMADVSHLADRQITVLSGGELQRVLLARALRMRPRVLMLDEATRGLDREGTAAFYRQVAKTRDKLGCAVIMASHDLHVVMSASDRVVCLNNHMCCQGSPEQVSRNPEFIKLLGENTADAFALYTHSRGSTVESERGFEAPS